MVEVCVLMECTYARGFDPFAYAMGLYIHSLPIVEDKMLLKMAVFWVVVPCRLVEVYRRLRDACCLHHLSYSSP
jgi:hypothetical protein